jgi:hypothetical protein
MFLDETRLSPMNPDNEMKVIIKADVATAFFISNPRMRRRGDQECDHNNRK